jgi:diguanylate cyclase (GGDEF)-like protein
MDPFSNRPQGEGRQSMFTSEEPKTRARNALVKLLELSLPPTPENFSRFYYEKELPSMEDLFRMLLDITVVLADAQDDLTVKEHLFSLKNMMQAEVPAPTLQPRIETTLQTLQTRVEQMSRSHMRRPSAEPPPRTLHTTPSPPPPITMHTPPAHTHRFQPNPEPARKDFSVNEVHSALEKLTNEANKLQSQMDHIKNLVRNMESKMGLIQKHNKRVTREANNDHLTGILNRRGLTNKLTFLKDTVISLLIFDIDNFKAVNDTHGHNAGDEVLKKIASVTRTLIRNVDLFARYGGDEFIVLMPGVEIAQAKYVAERIRSNIEKLPVFIGNRSVEVTASFGLTGTYMDGIRKMDDLMEVADSALYQAKNQGKNQICVTNPIP